MQTVTFGTLKGGVGKTMLCFNIGCILSQMGHRILIIDSDLQGNLTNNLGIDRTKPGIHTLYDVYNPDRPQPLPEALVCVAPNPQLLNLDIITASIFLHRAELNLSTLPDRELLLSKYIHAHSIFFSQYDFILIDTNPSMSIVNQNAFAASDSILLVSDVSMNALEGAQLFIALWEESRCRLHLPDNVKGFIVNDVDTRNRLSLDFLDYLSNDESLDDLRPLLLRTVIPRNVRLTEAELAAMPISLYDLHSKGAIAITALIEELLNRKIL